MFCSRQTNNIINKLKEGALKIVLNNHISDFETLLQKSNDISSLHRNIQVLLIELYKMKTEISRSVMDSIVNWRNVTHSFGNL